MMFCTSPDGAIRIPPIFDNNDEHWWSYIRLPLFSPYFQVVCSGSSRATSESFQTFFLQTVDQLIKVVSDDAVNVTEVQLVTPGHMNAKGLWQIDVLERVFRGLEVNQKDHKQYAFVYAIAGGQRYLESCVAKVESELTELELVLDLSVQPNTGVVGTADCR